MAHGVGWAGLPALSAELVAEYRAAGLDYAPPGSPLETVDELRRVRGMTADLLAALRPHLTLFGPAEPNPASADPIVAAARALARQRAPLAGPGPNARAPDPGTPPPHPTPRRPVEARVTRARAPRLTLAI